MGLPRSYAGKTLNLHMFFCSVRLKVLSRGPAEMAHIRFLLRLELVARVASLAVALPLCVVWFVRRQEADWWAYRKAALVSLFLPFWVWGMNVILSCWIDFRNKKPKDDLPQELPNTSIAAQGIMLLLFFYAIFATPDFKASN